MYACWAPFGEGGVILFDFQGFKYILCIYLKMDIVVKDADVDLVNTTFKCESCEEDGDLVSANSCQLCEKDGDVTLDLSTDKKEPSYGGILLPASKITSQLLPFLCKKVSKFALNKSRSRNVMSSSTIST
jgi:hypothetical protein